MLSMDEMVRQERDIGYQMMKTENIVKNVVTSASPNMIKNVVRLTEMFEHYVEDMQSNYADDMLLNNFVCIQQNVADIDSFTVDDVEPTPEIIENVKARLEKLSKIYQMKIITQRVSAKMVSVIQICSFFLGQSVSVLSSFTAAKIFNKEML